MSRIDLAPAQTTATRVRESSTRSAEMSNVSSTPRCTPPMPPVAKISMPASPATNIVAATVVPAEPLRAATSARSRREALTTPPLNWPRRSISCRSRPTLKRPSMTAIVAGTAPISRTASSTVSAVSTLRGKGMPWVMIVDSSATIGFLADLASATSGEKSIRSAALIASSLSSRAAAIGRFQHIGNLAFMINGANLCRKAMPSSDRLRSSGFALRLHRSATEFESMDDKPDHVPVQPDLVASIRQARIENAERAEARAEASELEIARLKALESALEPVVDQAPQGVDLFDMALTQSEHPRLFLDMIAFVDMAHDKRTYRFFQDTRQGRLLMAESQSVDTIVAAVADYVARRLVERERALTVGPRVAEEPPAQPLEANGPATWPIARPRPRALHFPPPAGSGPLAAAEQPRASPKRGILRRLGDALSLFLMLVGAITLALLLGVGADWAWSTRLRDLWTHWIGAPPF